jgi:hypothetical protein
MNSPNRNYDHVYVVIRYDSYQEDIEYAVTVLKVFITEEEAKNEVTRLNSLILKRIKDKTLIEQKRYFYQIGRIKKGILKVDKNSNKNGRDKFE